MNFRPILMFQGALFLALVAWNAFAIGTSAVSKKDDTTKTRPYALAMKR